MNAVWEDLMRGLLLTFALVACKGGADTDSDPLGEADADTDSDTDADADTDADTDSDTDTDADADTDADTDSDTDTDTDPGGFTLVDVSYECDGSDTGALTPILTATVSGSRVDIVHAEHAYGCCPTLGVNVSSLGNALTATYSLTGDLCDCICELDILYGIEGLTPGAWTLDAEGETVGFTIP